MRRDRIQKYASTIPAIALYFPPKSVGEALVVTVVVSQFSSDVTARDDVVVGPGELDTWRLGHSGCRSVNVH